MFHKLFKVHKLSSRRPEPPLPPTRLARSVARPDPKERMLSSTLKIVHAGGATECYFMPFPASRIMEKHPSCYVTRPDVFRRPWESVLGPDEVLVLGEKYYVVPRHTVKKLRRRTRRPSSKDTMSSTGSFALSKSFKYNGQHGDVSSASDVSGGGFDKVAKKKSDVVGGESINKKVRFAGVGLVDDKPIAKYNRKKGRASVMPMTTTPENKKNDNYRKEDKKQQSESIEGKKKIKGGLNWQPSLASITEVQDSDG